jgi:hypothetical protein
MSALLGIIRKLLVLFLLVAAWLSAAAENPAPKSKQPRWLWVKDYYTELGIAGAWVDIAPGDKCLGQTKFAEVKWTAHYVTDGAGRVLVHGLPEKLSCRVTVNGQQLNVYAYGFDFSHQNKLPSWIQLRPYTSTIFTMPEADRNRTTPNNYWESNDPTQFRSYIQNPDTAELLSAVKVTALPSGITTTRDANGLFTLEVPASYRKGEFPTMAVQTLVFSKPGYKTLEYRQLVLHPGVQHVEVFLPKGSGTLVRTNGSIYPGNPYDDKFAAYPGNAPEHAPRGSGEMISFEITPWTDDGGWITCGKGAKAIVKARYLTKVGIGWIPTGTGVTDSVGITMTKVSTSPEGDMWEAPLSQIMSTSFAAGGVDKHGKGARSMNLGGVYCE